MRKHPGSEAFAGQCGRLVGAGFQFQIAQQPDTALGMQDRVDLLDCGKDDIEFTLDIGTGGMGFQDERMALEQFDNPVDLLPDRDAISDRNKL